MKNNDIHITLKFTINDNLFVVITTLKNIKLLSCKNYLL